MEEINCYNRRQFISRVGTLIGAGVTIPFLSFLSSCDNDEDPIKRETGIYNLNISNYPDLNNVGGFAKVLIPGKNNNNPIIIKRLSDTNFVVLDSACSHEGCIVDLPQSGDVKLKCPCHLVIFSIDDGSIMENPLSSWSGIPLTKFNFEYDKTKQILAIEI